MAFKAWLYFGFTAVLALTLAGIMAYFFRGKRKERVESPKYRMLDDD
jgi:hypothetical protein